MDAIASLALLAGIYLAVLASPGPNFFILTQMALDGRRREARLIVFGLTTGSLLWVGLALAGLGALFARHPWLASAVRVVGAAYLVWYGLCLLRGAFAPTTDRRDVSGGAARSGRSAYRTGLLTGMTNPKGAAFWTSAFATVYPAAAPAWFDAATVLLVVALSLGWHLGIVVVFGRPKLRAAYLRVERKVDSIAGGALVLFGLQRMVTR